MMSMDGEVGDSRAGYGAWWSWLFFVHPTAHLDFIEAARHSDGPSRSSTGPPAFTKSTALVSGVVRGTLRPSRRRDN